ncbi:MAG: hypothetical protein QOH08_1475 [Chloroflexota bacterium]|nr:hypothetical protein [Chloroflexota bacterium]
MARLAHGCAALAVLAVLALSPAAGATTQISTVAGGGTTPMNYRFTGDPLPAINAIVPSPGSVSYAGFQDGFWTIPQDSTCVVARVQTGSNADTGLIGFDYGTKNGCSPPAGPFSGFTYQLTFANPCCVALLKTTPGVSVLVANSDRGRVELINDAGAAATWAGGTQAALCGTGTPPAVPNDPATRTSATFCTITGLAGTGPGNDGKFVIGENGREAAASDKGHIYFVSAAGTVYHLSAPLTLGKQFISGGLAFAPNGDVLVADGVGEVYFITNLTTVSAAGHLAGSTFPGFADGSGFGAKFDHPRGITVGYDGAVYIADTGNCRVRRMASVDEAAPVTTIAGRNCQTEAPPYGDGGPSTEGTFDHPRAITMEPGGLLVTDTGHNRVRLINRTSIVSGPGAATADSTPDFTFASLDTTPALKCTLDGGAPADCASPYTLPAAGDGSHTLRVWENNAPSDPTPAVREFKVDTTGPTGVALTAPADKASEPSPSPSFSWSEAQDATTSVDHYELWIDQAKNRDVPTSACSDGVCSAQPAAGLGESAHTWSVRAVDAVGNTGSSEERTLVTASVPTVSLQVNPNPALVGRPVTFSATAADPSGIARYQWDLDGDGVFERDSGAAATTTRSFDAPATVVTAVRVTDGVGTTATASTPLKISNPAGAASLLGISVNSGAQYTRTPDVTLLVKAPTTASSILVSNDGGFLAPATFPIASSIKWKLDSSGPERLPKTVYARFMLGPIISETYTDDIILDEVPPVVQQASLAPTRAPKGASAAVLKQFVVKVKARDSNSGVAGVQVTANKKKPGKVLKYKTKLTVKLAKKPKFLRARDRAGNFSGWKRIR